MLIISLGLITLFFFIQSVRHIQMEGFLFPTYATLFFISLLSTFIVPPFYECSKYNKEITVKVIDKYLGESCSSKGRNCSRTYMFVLETEKGYKFESSFNVDSYYRFNVGNKITYTPYSCHQSKVLFDK